MKVYSFFLNPQKVPRDFIFLEENSYCLKDGYQGFHPVKTLEDEGKIILYGITNKEKYMEMFRNTRDTTKLLLFKSDIPKEKYKEMLHKFSLKEYEIKPVTLMDGKTGKDKKNINVFLTEFEKQKINDEIILCQMLWSFLFKEKGDGKIVYSEVFTDKVQTLLNSIFYNELSKLISDLGANDGDMDYGELNAVRDLLKITEGTELNTFSIFVNLFQCVLK